MKFGIELEFFVSKGEGDKKIYVPAYLVTSNTDGNPVIGEIRTGVFDSFIDCIFDLKKRFFLEKTKIEKAGYNLELVSEIKVNDEFLLNLRKDTKYINKKSLEVLEEKSIYPKGSVGKMLPRGVYKASLQINFSEHKNFTYTDYVKVTVDDKYKYESKTATKTYAVVFDYLSLLSKLDVVFLEEIKATKRVSGVYAIKTGELGDRIEYRSLPNTVELDKLLTLKF